MRGINMKYISVKELKEKGYLQELNRCFLHPLGLSLEIVVEEDGKERLGGIWDCRYNHEGIIYTDEIINSDDFKGKITRVKIELETRLKYRKEKLGFGIQCED